MMDGMYEAVLTLHSWNRWLALGLGLAATLNAFNEPPTPAPRPKGSRWDTFFMAAVDVQVLFGLLLYFGLSPFTTEAMNNFQSAVRTPGLRFWAVDHVVVMFAAVLLVRLGRVFAMTGKTPEVRRTRRLVCFVLALLAMLVAIPWPGLTHGRPLLRVWPSAGH
jgi:hypothetical protein